MPVSRFAFSSRSSYLSFSASLRSAFASYNVGMRRYEPPPPPAAPTPKAWTFIGRALRLRCPECGVSPLFVPFNRVRSLDDWFRPLDGCPRCGYAYEREQGYWLIAIWAINYGLVGVIGVTIALLALEYAHFPIWKAILIVAVPMPMLSFLFARHAKALYLAMDHYFDPHVK